MTDASASPGTIPRYTDFSVGDELTPIVRGPLSPAYLMRWSAAIENWHRIHYDVPFAAGHDGLPALLVNGSWKQHFLVQMVRAAIGPSGWLVKVTFSFRRMDVVGSVLTAHGTVTGKRVENGIGFLDCAIGIRNEAGDESTPGAAVAALPLDGVPLPYPFPGA
jgi:acyl dehydratase